MGGKDLVRRVKVVQAKQFGHSFALEESERPEGPWISTYIEGDTIADFDQMSVSFKGRLSGLIYSGSSAVSTQSTREKPSGASSFLGMTRKNRLALGPERVLFAALASSDLSVDAPNRFHDVPHDVLKFKWGAAPVRVFLNRYTHLPAAVESIQVSDGFWSIWGDVKERVIWGNWDIAKGGLRFPTLWSLDRNGLRQEDDSLLGLQISYGGPDPAIESKLADLAAPSRPRPLPQFKASEIAPGIVQYEGQFNCTAVDQGDGIVCFEGVLSAEYMGEVMRDVAKRFPGKPVKAVVSSDDAWPHIGGLRWFVARKIPIYALRATQPLLRRVFGAPHTIRPDDLTRMRNAPILRLIDSKVEIGEGSNRVVVYPVHGSGLERALYGYFPERRLLYAPDVIQRSGDHWFGLNFLSELLDALSRDGVRPETAFSIHSGPVGVSLLRQAVADARG